MSGRARKLCGKVRKIVIQITDVFAREMHHFLFKYVRVITVTIGCDDGPIFLSQKL